VTSDYALDIGLVNEIVAADKLDERARSMAALLSSRSGRALAEIRRLVYSGLDVSLQDGLKLEREALPAILGSADYAEGLAAFEERREPRFTEAAR
jgi:enoyl-CoA hydratase/carnithine racemase